MSESFIYTAENFHGTQISQTFTITSCMDCPYHKVVVDPDPYDFFNADDEAVICLRSNKKPKTIGWGNYRCGDPVVTCACRPYQLRAETTPIPSWCPIRPLLELDSNNKINSNDEKIKPEDMKLDENEKTKEQSMFDFIINL